MNMRLRRRKIQHLRLKLEYYLPFPLNARHLICETREVILFSAVKYTLLQQQGNPTAIFLRVMKSGRTTMSHPIRSRLVAHQSMVSPSGGSYLKWWCFDINTWSPEVYNFTFHLFGVVSRCRDPHLQFKWVNVPYICSIWWSVIFTTLITFEACYFML